MKLMKELPTLFKRKEECCGCSACANNCPLSLIIMMTDDEGFEYPYITDTDKCLRCYKCISVCQYQN